MVVYMERDVLEDVAIIGGLVGVQFVYAGNSVLLGYLMSLGLSPFTIVIFSTLATFIILSPFAVYFERSKWPKQLTLKLIIQLILISFGGVTLFQSLFLKGINLTSPAVATAMPNLAPGLIFIIAWTCRLEKVAVSCLYSKIKIAGTFLCVLGALTMSLMQCAVSSKDSRMIAPPTDDVIFDKDKIIGCMYLIAAVLVLSSNVVLQATTLGDFPAPMSLCAITSLIGVIITAMVQLVEDHDLVWGWPLVSVRELIGFSLLGGAVSGACVSFNGWAMKKRGPVLVSMFSPIGTVITVVISFITLGETISLGSLAGMFLMFTGLYFAYGPKEKKFTLMGMAWKKLDIPAACTVFWLYVKMIESAWRRELRVELDKCYYSFWKFPSTKEIYFLINLISLALCRGCSSSRVLEKVETSATQAIC